MGLCWEDIDWNLGLARVKRAKVGSEVKGTKNREHSGCGTEQPCTPGAATPERAILSQGAGGIHQSKYRDRLQLSAGTLEGLDSGDEENRDQVSQTVSDTAHVCDFELDGRSKPDVGQSADGAHQHENAVGGLLTVDRHGGPEQRAEQA